MNAFLSHSFKVMLIWDLIMINEYTTNFFFIKVSNFFTITIKFQSLITFDNLADILGKVYNDTFELIFLKTHKWRRKCTIKIRLCRFFQRLLPWLVNHYIHICIIYRAIYSKWTKLELLLSGSLAEK